MCVSQHGHTSNTSPWLSLRPDPSPDASSLGPSLVSKEEADACLDGHDLKKAPTHHTKSLSHRPA